MRKWQNLAAPDDPNSWYGVDGVWPTPRGSYETCTLLTAGLTRTDDTTGGNGTGAFVGRTLSGSREYLVVPLAIYEYSGAFTDRTGGVTVGSHPMFAQYGDVTILTMGVGTATCKSTGGNFSALAGAPQGEIVLICAGAVVVLNTNTSTDGWATSDVFDYTNWTTNEAASGRLLDTNGPILAGCVFGGCVYAFKSNSIYRGRYVGGVVKWAWEVVEHNVGVAVTTASASSSNHSVCAGTHEMMFIGPADSTHFAVGSGKSGPAPRSYYAYLFDGVSPPRICNRLTSITAGNAFLPTAPPGILHDPQSNIYTVTTQNVGYFYNADMDAWGYKSTLMAGIDSQLSLLTVPIYGDFTARSAVTPMPEFYGRTAVTLAGGVPWTFTRFALDTTLANIPNHYLQSSMFGRADQKTAFSRLTPRLRRRNGSGTAALSATFYRELENTTAETTLAITESTVRKRFDVTGQGSTDNFARFKVTYNALDVEVEDFTPAGVPAGKD
jgi:hypothetical protein